DEVKLGFRQLRGGRVENVVAVTEADAGGAQRPLEGNARQHQCGGRAEQRRDVGIDFGVHRHHGGDDLDFVAEAFREQRTDRPVDEARGQRLLLRRAAFALEETARNAPGGISLFLVVDRQRKEILARGGALAADRGDQDDGVVHVDEHCRVRLAGDGTCFKGDGVISELETLLDCLHVYSLFLTLFGTETPGGPPPAALSGRKNEETGTFQSGFFLCAEFSSARRGRLSGAAPTVRSAAGNGRDSCS